MKLKLFVLVAVLCALSAEALADVVRVRRHRVHEVCFDMRAGQEMVYAFSATGDLDFNVHYHAGDDVHYLAEQKAAAQGKGAIIVPVDQHYCLMWRNGSSRAAMLDFIYSTGNIAADAPIEIPD